MAGRPSVYSTKLGKQIASRLIQGESLRKICADSKMPSMATVCRWLADPEHSFREHYANARDIQAEIFADEIVDIADDDEGDVQRAKLRVDARKWVVSKLLPKKYGDRMTHAGDAENPIAVTSIERRIVDP